MDPTARPADTELVTAGAPPSGPATDHEMIDAVLRVAGATDADLAQARDEGWLPLLALDRTLMPGRGRYDLDGLAAAADAPREVAVALWRALGFPDVPDGVAAFTESDAAMMRALLARGEARGPLEPAALARLEEQVRVISGALARIATLEAEEVANAEAALRDAGCTDEEIALAIVDALDWDNLSSLVDYAHRIQLRAALWRRLALPQHAGTPELAVGFADIAGYTAISEQVDETELSALLSRFEGRVYDTVAGRGARIVKSIGDAVMFVGLPASVARVALELSEPYEGLPSLRQGVAYGPVLARDGDYYGPIVNLASRLSDIANPGTVLATEAMRDQLVDDEELRFRALRSRRIRGIGEVRPYALRAGTPSEGG